MTLRRGLAIVHRWLGAALSALFAMWFATGMVMVFARYPELDDRERLATLPPIDAARVAAPPPTPSASRVTLTSAGGQPVWHVDVAGRAPLVHAADGTIAAPWTANDAAAEVRRRLGLSVDPSRTAWLTAPDQWTLYPAMTRQLPAWRLAATDAAATEIYVTASSGDLVQVTTRRARVLAWLGAIPHWIYPRVLVHHRAAWRQLVIGVAVAGAVMCGLGLVLGLWSWRRRPGGRLGASPYADRWLRWHHVLGLSFGLFAFTWALSGALSLTPLDWSPGDGPSAADRRALAGAAIDGRDWGDVAAVVRGCASDGDAPRQVELMVLGGDRFHLCRWSQTRTRLVDAGGSLREDFTTAEVVAAVRRGWPERMITAAALRDQPDAYHRASHHAPPLRPYVRVALDDGTTLYVEAASGTLLRRHGARSRLERWLYSGLHSLDLPWLYRRPWLWHLVILSLLVAGLALSVTGVVTSVRWARRARWRRLSRRDGIAVVPG